MSPCGGTADGIGETTTLPQAGRRSLTTRRTASPARRAVGGHSKAEQLRSALSHVMQMTIQAFSKCSYGNRDNAAIVNSGSTDTPAFLSHRMRTRRCTAIRNCAPRPLLLLLVVIPFTLLPTPLRQHDRQRRLSLRRIVERPRRRALDERNRACRVRCGVARRFSRDE